MDANVFKLNPDKTEILLVSTKAILNRVPEFSIDIEGIIVKSSNT